MDSINSIKTKTKNLDQKLAYPFLFSLMSYPSTTVKEKIIRIEGDSKKLLYISCCNRRNIYILSIYCMKPIIISKSKGTYSCKKAMPKDHFSSNSYCKSSNSRAVTVTWLCCCCCICISYFKNSAAAKEINCCTKSNSFCCSKI